MIDEIGRLDFVGLTCFQYRSKTLKIWASGLHKSANSRKTNLSGT